jgi:plasmid stabilization system protein ParE
MKVGYAPRALRDIADILAYLDEHNPTAAKQVFLAIQNSIDLCALNPLATVSTDEPNVYRRPLPHYRYAIFYRVLPGSDAIEIARIIHGARLKDLRALPND